VIRYSVIIQPPATAEIEDAYLFIHQYSPARAEKWVNELATAIATLETLPFRCPIAPENDLFDYEIRQLIQLPYRVLYTIVGESVHILHVRHIAQRPVD
jgi:plasmid stabilization system protein ParE